jgi:phage tail tape-measure protein
MNRPWVAAVLTLAFASAPLFAQIDMSQGPVLSSRNQGYAANVIPADTQFQIQLKDTLDTSKDQPGKKFKAKLAQDLVAQDGTSIPMGSEVKGHVSDVQRGLHSSLLLSFDEIKTRHGWVPLAATVAGVPGEHGVQSETGPEGEIKHNKVDARREIETAAAGAAIGAIAGAAAGGGRGAAIGAGAGGALGTGVGLLTGRNIRLNKGQSVELRLDRDIFLPRG